MSLRNLLHVPILHSPVDLGSVADDVEAAFIMIHGLEKLQAHREEVARFWKSLAGRLDEMGLEWPLVRIYQDGLPVCGRELDILRQVARLGSPNHQLVEKLLERGARLEGTENPRLLLEEYQASRALYQKWKAGPESRLSPEESKARAELLKRRDAFIAARIGETLRSGETGLLFLGAAHAPERDLPPDIRVSRLA